MSENPSRYNHAMRPVASNVLSDIVIQFILPYKENYAGVISLLEKILAIKNINFEIMIVDDNSKNKTFFDEMNKLNGVSGFRFDEDKGFGYCVNFAVNKTERNICIVLHSDINHFETNTFKNLVLGLISGKNEKVALVSSVMDNPMPKECAWIKQNEAISSGLKILSNEHFVPFISAAFSKSVFLKVGGMPQYPYCWFEDKVFCKKLYAFGYKAGVVQNSFIRHEGSVSLKQIINRNPQVLQTIKKNKNLHDKEITAYQALLNSQSV
jgi:GT2 family glycosyltransferase